jgi:phosphoribosylamine--glycine ligase
VPIGAACDYKRAGDGDTGPNTGGMGAYSPPWGFPENLYDVVRERVLDPVLRGLREEGESYVGVLYCGLMWTDAGPKVIEFNVRFGDPETQALLPRMRGDFARAVYDVATGSRDPEPLAFTDDSCVAVVLATRDYPVRGTPLTGLPADIVPGDGCSLFWGASTLRDGKVDAGGGRVLTLSALGDTLVQARRNAYAAVGAIANRLPGGTLSYRTDIAAIADQLEAPKR